VVSRVRILDTNGCVELLPDMAVNEVSNSEMIKQELSIDTTHKSEKLNQRINSCASIFKILVSTDDESPNN